MPTSNKSESFSLRDSLKSIREIKKETPIVGVKGKKDTTLLSFLKEDFGNFNNQDFQEIQESITQAVNAPCTITNYDGDSGQKIEVRGVIKFTTDVNFLFTTQQTDGVYIWTSQKGLQLDEDVIQSVMKLRAYYDTWYQESLQKVGN